MRLSLTMARIWRAEAAGASLPSVIVLALVFLICSTTVGQMWAQESQPVALSGVVAIDPASGVTVPDAVIVLQAGRIKAIGPASKVKVPQGAQTLALRGKFVMPGLIDAHVHYGLGPLPDLLAWGVTAVLVTGQPDSLGPYRRHAAPDSARVPRFFSVGRQFAAKHGWGDFGPGSGNFPASTEEARVQVRAAKSAGVDALKLIYDDMSWLRSTRMPMLPASVVAAIISEGHRQGLRTFVHAPILEHAKVALRSGADGLVHGIISEPVDDEFLALMRRNRATYTATLSLYEALADRHKVVARLRTLDRAHRVSDSTWKELLEPEELSSYRKFYDLGDSVAARLGIGRDNVSRVAAAGIPVVAGTDTPVPGVVPGVSSQAELVLLEEAGLKPMQAIQAATTVAASILGQATQLGTLRPGAVADLLVLEADPRISTRNIGTLAWVVRGGHPYRPSELPVPTAVVGHSSRE
jgi:imidazolonepropionase-like amidohydrolase